MKKNASRSINEVERTAVDISDILLGVNKEIETKLQVPLSSKAAVAAEMAKSRSLDCITLAARYLDTSDRRLAQAGIAWRLRREGGQWVQTLKAAHGNKVERFEHEVIRAEPVHDASLHAGTPAGDRLNAILKEARREGIEPEVRFCTEVQRIACQVRTRLAVVEVAFDQGRIVAGERWQPISELEFELVSGSTAGMFALAERWLKQFDLVFEPRTKADRGDRLAEGFELPEVRTASRPNYPKEATPIEALLAVLEDCVAHITHNAVGICEGNMKTRIEHVHQMRVGIRRLRSAIRSFKNWVPLPPQHLIDDLRVVFVTLGRSRDADILDSHILVELAKAGGPPTRPMKRDSSIDVVAYVRAASVQRLLLQWVEWLAHLAESIQPVQEAHGTVESSSTSHDFKVDRPDAHAVDRTRSLMQAVDAKIDVHSRARKRLRKWHGWIVRETANFNNLDEAALHALRKRIKRQRYAVEFFGPLLHRRRAKDYLKALAAAQECMGVLHDLFVARYRYKALVPEDPTAWFALGWLAARISGAFTATKGALDDLVEADVP